MLGLLAVPRTFGELMHVRKAREREAARAVSALLERGFARKREAAPPPAAAVVATLAPPAQVEPQGQQP